MSSLTTPNSQLATPGLGIAYTESCHCLQCQGAIAREDIRTKIGTERLGPTRRTCEAYCRFCNVLYVATQELREGVWQIVGGVQHVTSGARLKAAALRGERTGNSQLATRH